MRISLFASVFSLIALSATACQQNNSAVLEDNTAQDEATEEAPTIALEAKIKDVYVLGAMVMPSTHVSLTYDLPCWAKLEAGSPKVDSKKTSQGYTVVFEGVAKDSRSIGTASCQGFKTITVKDIFVDRGAIDPSKITLVNKGVEAKPTQPRATHIEYTVIEEGTQSDLKIGDTLLLAADFSEIQFQEFGEKVSKTCELGATAMPGADKDFNIFCGGLADLTLITISADNETLAFNVDTILKKSEESK